jgi:hypothetical protein
MIALLTAWMKVSRPVEWNGRRIRKEWSEGSSTKVYQEKVLEVLKIWYLRKILMLCHLFAHFSWFFFMTNLLLLPLGVVIALALKDWRND